MLKDISVNEALNIILKHSHATSTEKVFLNDSLNRVIAENILAPYNIPYFDNSAMDGYAIKSEDTKNASENAPAKLKIVDEIPAGKLDEITLKSGEAVKIMTGGIIPSGADAVARVEITKREKDFVHIFEYVKKEKDLRKSGEDVKKDSLTIKKDTLITPAIMGMLAALGRAFIKVYRKPVVSVIVTGDEILDIDEPYIPGKIRNSNGFTLLGLLKQFNITPFITEIVKDDKDALIDTIKSCLNSDIILSTGGVSMGDYDFIKDIVPALGFEPLFWRVRVKPGKPLFFAKKDKTLYFGIPGNPVSTMSTFYNFILPCIKKMNNIPNIDLFTLQAITTENIKRKDLRSEFLRGILTRKDDKFYVKTTGSQGSGILSSMIKGNCFIYIEEGVDDIKKGSKVTVKLFNEV